MLMQRGSTWYFRRIVPLALRPLMEGKREIWRSLRTSDLNEAKLLSLREGQEVERLFQDLRKQANIAQADPQSLARLHETRARSADVQHRLTRDAGDDGTFESARRHTEMLDAELDALKSAVDDHRASLRLQDTSIVSTLLDELLTDHRLHVPIPRRREFALALLKAHTRVLEAGVKRASGGSMETLGVSVGGLLDAFLAERKLPSKSEAEFRACYRRFTALVGEHTPARDVTKAECRAYKESLLAAPSNRSLAKDGTLSPASVKKLLGIVSTIWRYGVSQGLVNLNPFEGITRVVRGDTAGVAKRLPYDSADLKAIFGSDAFAKLTGARQWISLIALYSGARLEEIAGLRVQDIKEVDSVLCFSFEPHEERRLKTASSRRQVPVHPELIRRGLLDYMEMPPKNGRLFPELKPGPHGKLAGAFSKWWGRFTEQQGSADPLKTFHSLRHTFTDSLRRAKVEPELRSQLLGHSAGNMTARYGSGHDLRALQEAVNAVEYEGISR
jgi:integrase